MSGSSDGIEYLAPVESPCVSLCVMDEATGWCLGCGRTIDEIAGWGSAALAERARTMDALPARMARLEELPVPRAAR